MAALALAAAPGLAGCVTTQQRNERAELAAKRLLAGRHPLRLGAPGDVRVTRVALIRSRRAGAFVVELANAGARPAADVPVAVGVRRRGRRIVLDRRGGGWFGNHVASIPAHGRARWVFVTRHRLARGARPFAVAGAPSASLPGRPDGPLPALVSSAGAGRPLPVTVHNRGSVPQFALPVYAFARRGGRYVAAGRATVPHLGTAGIATVRIPLVGAGSGAALQTEVLPSTFR